MSLNKFVDNSIKNYITIGAKTINTTECKINGKDVSNRIYGSGLLPVNLSNLISGTINSVSNIWYEEKNYLTISFSVSISTTTNTQQLVFTLDLPPGYTTSLNQFIYGYCHASQMGPVQFINNSMTTDGTLNNRLVFSLVSNNTMPPDTAYVNGEVRFPVLTKP